MGGRLFFSPTSAAKAGIENKPVIAALKALRYPKSNTDLRRCDTQN
jgi:hypothetical protein